ncbi:restriction endonuclease subunit S [Aureibaculum sp. 2210JD6-5]|uniref:restriction endonuclease subunit S n=1 Tax=Aureibaculum sp. 2210JD6-5 TaxID=3103957 RepID=UPI002AAED22F|nr:restriction endonuclease subunit S [Aureibaculum sp. 2210JD6-5]MDY7396292.1 restriction endonuclease subunit S [Aureibaculum sp. 2210JD6-5]
MNSWQQKKLIDVANIKLSNVDKKTKENERIVRLCNYTDVYKNSFINKERATDFMIASCSENAFEKFILREGQVAITKDSEKPDDIGIPTYISEDFSDVVLGYHLSLITPFEDKLSGRFLNYWLQTKFSKRYFECNAGGSGQRCTLVLDVIKSIPLYLPSLTEQKQIAKVLSDLEVKIEVNNKINQELEAMAKTLYDYWFVQFDFPDANGKPYKSSGGKMVYNKVLKREIPEGWEVKELGVISEIKRGKLVTAKTADLNGKYKVVSAGINYSYLHSESNREKNTITVSGSGANAGFVNFWREPIFANDCTTVRGNSENETLVILQFLKLRQEYILNQARGSAQPHVYPKDLSILKISIPNNKLFTTYGEKIIPSNELIANNLRQNQKLTELRDWLLPMLMNGQVTVGEAEQSVNEELAMVAEDGVSYNMEETFKMTVVQPIDNSATIIGTHIIKKLEKSPGMGRTKFQKVLHLSEYYCKRELGGLYIRNAAGPHNECLLNYIEGKFKNYNHVNVSSDIVNGHKHIVYKTTSSTIESETAYKGLPQNFRERLDKLIDLLAPLNLKQTEAISTLYAIWNNRIIENKEINNATLILSFYKWSDRKKQQFIDQDILNALDFMKMHQITPIGWGNYIAKE